MDWNLLNYRQQLERDEPKTDLFSDTLFKEIKKKKRGATSEITEVRERTAKLINRTIPFVCGKTKHMNSQQIYELLRAAENFKQNPAACWWKIYNEKYKIKKICE